MSTITAVITDMIARVPVWRKSEIGPWREVGKSRSMQRMAVLKYVVKNGNLTEFPDLFKALGGRDPDEIEQALDAIIKQEEDKVQNR